MGFRFVSISTLGTFRNVHTISTIIGSCINMRNVLIWVYILICGLVLYLLQIDIGSFKD